MIYSLCLPVTVFISISRAPLESVFSLPLLLLTGALTTLLSMVTLGLGIFALRLATIV